VVMTSFPDYREVTLWAQKIQVMVTPRFIANHHISLDNKKDHQRLFIHIVEKKNGMTFLILTDSVRRRKKRTPKSLTTPVVKTKQPIRWEKRDEKNGVKRVLLSNYLKDNSIILGWLEERKLHGYFSTVQVIVKTLLEK